MKTETMAPNEEPSGANSLTAPDAIFLTPSQQMISSGAGALMVSLFMTPLDVVKIRLQTQDRMVSKKCFLYSNGIMDHLCARVNGDPPFRALHTAEEICNCKWYNRPKYFNGTLDAFLKISRTEGVSSLWSGLSPTLVLAIPTTMLYFTAYEQLKAMLNKPYVEYKEKMSVLTPNLPTSDTETAVDTSPLVSLTAGGLARIVAVTAVNPLELVRTKMQAQRMPLYQVKSCLKDLVATKGVLGLWSGYTATLLRDVPFSALYWPLYEYTRRWFGKETGMVNFMSGAVAGTVACTVTLPFDVVKTIKQIDLGEKDFLNLKTGISRTNSSIVRDILREQGAKGLFSGLIPRILKVAPACAIMISSYEFFKKFFKSKNEEIGHQNL